MTFRFSAIRLAAILPSISVIAFLMLLSIDTFDSGQIALPIATIVAATMIAIFTFWIGRNNPFISLSLKTKMYATDLNGESSASNGPSASRMRWSEYWGLIAYIALLSLMLQTLGLVCSAVLFLTGLSTGTAVASFAVALAFIFSGIMLLTMLLGLSVVMIPKHGESPDD